MTCGYIRGRAALRRPGSQVPLAVKLAAALAMAGTSCAAAPGRAAPDREAMREATRPGPPQRYPSSQAYAHYLRARQAEIQGDARAAADELTQALVHDPDSAELRLALAGSLARLAQLKPAEDEARRALQADPAGPTAAEAHVLLGKLAALDGRREEAIAELRQAIRLERGAAGGGPPGEGKVDPEPWRVLGQLQLEGGDEEGAARTFGDLVSLSPDQGAAFREMGRFFQERGDLERAEKYLRRAVEKDRRDVEAWRHLARLEQSRRRAQAGREAWEALLHVEPDDAEALLALGQAALGAGDAAGARARFQQLVRSARDENGARLSVALAWLDAHRPEEALAVAEEGLGSGPPDGRLLYVRGLALQEHRRWDEAARAFAAVGPEEGELYASARLSLAWALAHLGRHAEALRVVEAALATRPREARLVALKAWVLSRAGRAPEAVRLLEQALADRPGSPGGNEETAELHQALAASLEQAGRRADAVALLEKAVAERPKDEALRYALAVAREKAGQHEAAVAAMQDLLGMNPDHADALNFVGYSFAERGIRLDDAERLLVRALEIKPGSGYFMDSLGWVYFQKGDYARAVALLERADALSGPEPTILEHLGDAYRRSGRPGDAEKAYRRALRALEQGAEAERPTQQASLKRKIREVHAEVRPSRP